MVLVKYDTPKKLPIYFPMPTREMIPRIAARMVSFGTEAFGKGLSELTLRNFKALTINCSYKMVDIFAPLLGRVEVSGSVLCKNSTMSVGRFPTVLNK